MNEPSTIPRRDYLLLPLISMLTVVVLFAITETVTRIVWNAHDDNACVVDGAGPDGYQIKPNCVARTKSAEGHWATFTFNECGYRSNTSCRAAPPTALRIAILGASVSQGLNIPYEDTYFARSAAALSQRCGRTVDVQNLGKPKSSPLYAYHRVDEALALKPDALLFLLSPFDLEQRMDPQELAARNEAARPIKANAVREPMSFRRRIQLLLVESRSVLVAEHFLLQNRDTFLRLYMNYGDKADFLRQPLTDAWKQRFADVDMIIADMANKARHAGVQLIVIPVPSRAEAALLSKSQVPSGLDPFAFGRELEQAAIRHGASYVDLMKPFSKIPNSQDLFLTVDGHVNSDGQKVIADNLTAKLLEGNARGFSACTTAARASNADSGRDTP